MARTGDVDPIAWARQHTPILRSLADEHGDAQPFAGTTVAVNSHLEAKTGVLTETIAAAGAEVLVTSSEPFSTVGEVVEALDGHERITCFVEAGMDEEDWAQGQHDLLAAGPDLIVDDGCELIAKVHADHPEIAAQVRGAAEQTTAGIRRLEAMEAEDRLAFPVYGVNDTPMKHYFDNVHGTGESALANVMITMNTLLSGATVVVAGYGYCGRGVPRKVRGMGARTIVTEVDPRKALEAHMDGHRVMPMAEAAPRGEYFISTTGNRDVIRGEHIDAMQDGAVLANAGHFDVEISLDELAAGAVDTRDPRPGVTQYVMDDGRRINLLAAGRLVNLTGPYSQGHPAEVMDTTFAMMFVAIHDLHVRDDPLPPGLHGIPDRLDREVARRKLDALDISIDRLTEDQAEYLAEWDHPDMRF